MSVTDPVDKSASPLDAAVTERLCSYVRASPLPMLLMRLSDTTTIEVSDAFTEVVGRDRATCLATSPPDFTQEPEMSRASLSLLAAGKLDGYTRHARIRRPGGESLSADIRVNACSERWPRDLAVVALLPLDETAVRGDLAAPTVEPGATVLGTITADGVVERIGPDGSGLLPLPARNMLGESLLTAIHPEDHGLVLLLAAHAAAEQVTLSGRIRTHAREGGWVDSTLSLQPLAEAGDGPAGFAFLLAAGRGRAAAAQHGPVEELHQQIARTASYFRMIGAAAWLPRLSDVLTEDELQSLTPRETEIVGRLSTGQRVPGIAREMFLSPSTVRNHLTAVFRKFGVASQAELMDRLNEGTAG